MSSIVFSLPELIQNIASYADASKAVVLSGTNTTTYKALSNQSFFHSLFQARHPLITASEQSFPTVCKYHASNCWKVLCCYFEDDQSRMTMPDFEFKNLFPLFCEKLKLEQEELESDYEICQRVAYDTMFFPTDVDVLRDQQNCYEYESNKIQNLLAILKLHENEEVLDSYILTDTFLNYIVFIDSEIGNQVKLEKSKQKCLSEFDLCLEQIENILNNVEMLNLENIESICSMLNSLESKNSTRIWSVHAEYLKKLGVNDIPTKNMSEEELLLFLSGLQQTIRFVKALAKVSFNSVEARLHHDVNLATILNGGL